MTTVMELVQQVEECITNPPAGSDPHEIKKAFLLGLGIDYSVMEAAGLAALTILTRDANYKTGEEGHALAMLTHLIPDVRELYLRREYGKWWYWDTAAQRTVFEGDNPQVTPYSVLCNDCGSMLKPLTLQQLQSFKLTAFTKPSEPCAECNDDPKQNISAQFNAESLDEG